MHSLLILPAFRKTVANAKEFAHAAYEGQTDLAGDAYVRHVRRVADRASAKLAGLPGILQAVSVCEMLQIAWLRDVIKGMPYGSEHLRREGFSKLIVHAVCALSNVSGASYTAFIAHASLPASLGKLSDNEDNADLKRLAKLDEVMRTRLLAKYEPSMAMLREAARARGWRG